MTVLDKEDQPNCVDFFQSEDAQSNRSERVTAGSYGLTLVRASKGPAAARIEGMALFTINACLSGTCELMFDLGDGRQVQRNVPPGTVNIVPPHTSFDVSARSATTSLTAAFAMPALQSLFSRYRLGPDAVGHYYGYAIASQEAIALLEAIWNLARREGPAADLMVDAATLQLFAILSSDPDLSPLGASQPEDARVARVIDYLEAHVHEDVTVGTLAEVACLSPGHFSRVFKATTGEAVWAYVRRRRGEKAMDLLRSTRMSVAEIAYACGFANHSHLTACFKRQFGVTPTALRRSK